MRRIVRTGYALLAFFLLAGFSLENPQVPVDDILAGGPSPDGIPAILTPGFVPLDEAGYLTDEDRVVGIRIGNDARAYPIKILNYHQVVNDRVGGVPLAVTFCPLTQAALVFYRTVAGQEVTFGVSGLLYRSNVLIYDHQTQSLWSQLLRQAVAGPMAGRGLETHAATMSIAWEHWKRRFPASKVLSTQTGFERDYHIDPYADYSRFDKIWFPVGRVRRDLPPKTRVLGVASGSHAKAYPLDDLMAKGKTLHDLMGSRAIDIKVSAQGDITAVVAEGDKPLEYVGVYWFAWQAFYPHTQVAR